MTGGKTRIGEVGDTGAALDFADVTGDGNLTVAEVARVFRALAFYVGYGIAAEGAPDKRVPLSNLHGVVAVANLIAPFFAQSLISSSDFDGNGAASLDELLPDRGGDRLRGVMGTVRSAAVESALKGVFQTLFGTLLKYDEPHEAGSLEKISR